MTWQQKTVSKPLVDGIEQIAGQLDSAATVIDTTLGTAISILNTAKALYGTISDPYYAAMSAVLDELENLINDTFGAKIGYIIVTPNYAEEIDKVSPSDISLSLVRERLGFFTQSDDSPKRSGRHDILGNKLLTPKEIITLLRRSLYDTKDENRPTSSASGYIAALGFMITAPNMQDFTPLLKRLNDVLDLQEFKDWFDDLLDSLDEVDPTYESSLKSKKPDWEGTSLVKLFPDLEKQRDALLDMVGTLRGYVNTADDAIVDLINIMQKKVQKLKALVEDIKNIIESIKNALTATGVYTMTVTGVGGAPLLEQSFRDPFLESLSDNGYSAAVVFAAEGANSDAAVQSIENLIGLLVS